MPWVPLYTDQTFSVNVWPARLLLMGKFIVCTSGRVETTKLPSGHSWSSNCIVQPYHSQQVYNVLSSNVYGIALHTNLTYLSCYKADSLANL